MSKTLELINAVATGDAVATETAFNSAMAEKLSSMIDDKRIEVAQNMFRQPEQQPEETPQE